MQQLFKYDSMRNTSLNVRVALVFFLVLFSFNAQASCNSTNIDSFLNAKNIKFIDISTNKSKKWAKNYIKAVRSSKTSKIFLILATFCESSTVSRSFV